MFLRWRRRIKKQGAARRSMHGKEPYDIHWQAIILSNSRINGQVKQEHITTLGGITEDAMRSENRRSHFWNKARERLDRLANRITPQDREAIEAVIVFKFAEVLSHPDNQPDAVAMKAAKQAELRAKHKVLAPQMAKEKKLLKIGLAEHRKSLRQAAAQLLDDARACERSEEPGDQRR